MLTKADVNRARREAREGKREVVRSDGGVPGLALRVQAPGKDGSEGKAAFYLRYRRPADRKQVWKEIARWNDGDDAAALTKVRKIAGQWYEDVRCGIDPEERERQAAEMAKREAEATGQTVREVYDAFMQRIADPELGDRDGGDEVAMDFRLYVLPAWGSRPIASITRSEVAALLERIAARKVPHPNSPERLIGTPKMAKRVYKNLSRLFHFHAARNDTFQSPIVERMATALRLPTIHDMRRSHALCARDGRETDDEVVALWRATAEPTTFNAVVRAALLTGQRIWAEVAAMRRADIDRDGVWHIDPDRYKTEIKHEVPLPPFTLAFIRSQPVHREGQEWVFSNSGASHLLRENSIGAKQRLDARMLDELRKLAVEQGRDPRKVVLRPWQLRDLRRTARTLMSRPHLGIAPHVREVVLGHVLPNIFGTYDVHSYTDEKRDALAKLAAEVEQVVTAAVDRVRRVA